MSFDDPRKLYFFLDYISHNAWLAWHQVGALAQRHGLVVEPVPVVFGALLKAHGQVGPAEVPPKSAWMLRNILRKAQQRGIPINPPYSHPFNPLLALRVSCAAPAPKRLELVQRLFEAAWVQSRALHEERVIAEVLAEAGLDAPALLAAAQTEAVKEQLRSHTDHALAQGVFGVPTMLVRGELFWGYDDFEFLEAFLAGRDPLPPGAVGARWLGVKPSVQRRR